MRLGILLILSIFALALVFGEPTKASARQGCHGSGCSGTASCAGTASVGCSGSGAVSGPVQRVLGWRPFQRIRARGCGG